MKMKKVGALVLAGAVLTMGGVYATWSFSDRPVDFTSQDVGVTVAGTASSTKKGTFTPSKSDNTFLVVNQLSSMLAQDAYKDLVREEDKDRDAHTAYLMINPSQDAYIKFTFTPSEMTDLTTKTTGVPATLTYSWTHPSTNAYTINTETRRYDPNGTATDIFTLIEDKAVVDLNPWVEEAERDPNKLYWDRVGTEGNYSFEYKILASHLSEHIWINDFIVDTTVAYEAFKTAVGQSLLTIRLDEKTA